ncbi:GNAT family N-acetyltransferase [Enterobacter ludwigii]|uniref:GNAT family N-acetyltransferase n=1 Tax=Enterobacter ludwigii TaxID=299767 RepID=UPI003076570D
MILRVNTATATQIAGHFRIGESDFVEHLMGQVNIERYAVKIKKYGCTFEAWSDNQLIGLVAAYLNKEERTGFITNVSVLPGWQSYGIGNQLLRNSIGYLEEAGVEQIALEVLSVREKAIRLYSKHGFIISSAEQDTLMMVRKSRMSGPSRSR